MHLESYCGTESLKIFSGKDCRQLAVYFWQCYVKYWGKSTGSLAAVSRCLAEQKGIERKRLSAFYFRERERESARENTSTHTPGRPHTRNRITGCCACPAPARGSHGRAAGPRVRADGLVSAWSHGYQHHLTNPKLEARHGRRRELESRVLHACTLSHTCSFRLSEVPARWAHDDLPSNM